MKRRQEFIVFYRINYKSGKTYETKDVVTALTEFGAREVIEWLKKGLNITILSITPTYKYVGTAINSNNKILGDY